MSSVVSTIRLINIYAGLPVVAFGTLGNLLNIRCLWKTRHNPCGFLFIVLSIVNCWALFFGLFLRIISLLMNVDWSNTNLPWCKIRTGMTPTFFFLSLSCVCLASFDRFLISCRQQKFRKLSRLSVVRWAIIILFTLWMLHSIPYFFYGEIIYNPTTGSATCTLIVDAAYGFYRTYIIFPVYVGVLPSAILITTGALTYLNTKKLQLNQQRQLIQKQLTLMMLTQIPIIVFTTLPYTIFSQYILISSNASKSLNQRNIETVILNLLTVIFYLTFACQFFVFFASSAAFRRETIEFVLHRKNFNSSKMSPITMIPISHISPVTAKTS